MSKDDRLERYRTKRDFRHTAEPRGRRRKSRSGPRFVIQQHDATSLHYDFRLEVGGVLKSWAVPKGPSTNPEEKRLAIPTEDHPLEYEDFEGVIPEGQYGAGAVLVWDAGTYRNLSQHRDEGLPLEQALDAGHVAVWLEGNKLRGGYALTRIRTGKKEAWLLVKAADAEADRRRNPVRTQPESILSARTIAELGDRPRGRGGGTRRTP